MSSTASAQSIPTGNNGGAPEALARGKSVRFMSTDQGSGGTGEEFNPTTGKPGTWPSVLLVPGSSGLTDSIRSVALALAAKGYQVLAMDPYDGNLPTKLEANAVWTEGPHDKNVEKIEYALSYLENWIWSPQEWP